MVSLAMKSMSYMTNLKQDLVRFQKQVIITDLPQKCMAFTNRMESPGMRVTLHPRELQGYLFTSTRSLPRWVYLSSR